MFPIQIAEKFEINGSPLGGWLEGISFCLSQSGDVDLDYYVIKKNMNKKVLIIKEGKIIYHYINYNELDFLKSAIRDDYDIYHIFGTEMAYVEDIVAISPLGKTVISIQGLVSKISLHYLSNYDMYFNPSFITKIYMHLNHDLFKKRGVREERVLNRVKYVIGRTDWDRASLESINKELKYYHCNEILREIFYKDRWKWESCKRFSIFVSQASYSIKGMHMIVEIIKTIKEFYPDIICKIGGGNLLKSNTLATKLHMSYDYMIKKLIDNYGLEDNIIFLGSLTDNEVKENLINCNVYLLASSIENSSNSLAEAMLLGVPIVASYVGGTNNFIIHKEDGLLYPFDEPYLAAYYIKMMFEKVAFSRELANNAHEKAAIYFNRKNNISRLLAIYNDIIRKSINEDSNNAIYK